MYRVVSLVNCCFEDILVVQAISSLEASQCFVRVVLLLYDVLVFFNFTYMCMYISVHMDIDRYLVM